MRKKNKLLLLVLLFFFVFCKNAIAQDVETETQVEKENVLIGDEIKLTLSYGFNPEDCKIILPNLPDTFNHFEVLKVDKTDTILKDENILLLQHVTLICFDSGRWEIPNFNYNIYPNDGRNSFEDTTQKKFVNINTVEVDITKNSLPFAEIIEVDKPLWEKIKYYVLGALVLLLLLIVLYFYKKWKQKNGAKKPIVIAPKISPKEKALQGLKTIAQKYVFPITELKNYYTEIGDVLRAYLEEKYGMETFEKTSNEIISAYKKIVQKERSESGFEGLRKLLITADNVKFAKGKPSEEEIENAIELAKNTIEKSENVFIKLNQKNEPN